MSIKTTLIIFLLLIFTTHILQADTSFNFNTEALEFLYDEDIVTVATGSALPVSRAPAVTTIITSEDIKDMGAITLDEVLETVPGIHMSLSSYRFTPIISVRGIHTQLNSQILMLRNGIPITQLYFGDRGPNSTFSVESISRIEIVRGPGSAIFGADAFAGVINIITKDADNIDGVEGGVRYGSFNTKNIWAAYGKDFGDFDISFVIEQQNTDGDPGRIVDVDAQSQIDSIFGTQASLAPHQVYTGRKHTDIHFNIGYKDWKFNLWNWRQQTQVGAGLNQSIDPTGRGETNNYLVNLEHTNSDLFDSLDFKTSFSYMDINADSQQNIFPPGSVLPIGPDGNIDANNPVNIALFPDGVKGNPSKDEEHFMFDFTTFFTKFDNHRIRSAVGFKYLRHKGKETKNFGPGVIDTETLLPPPNINVIDGTITDVSETPYVYVSSHNQKVWYISLQDEWFFTDDWGLTTGVRYDYYSDFGSTVNPRIALVWQTNHELTTKLMYGRAFRAPSFSEMYAINNPVIQGNPNLDPEIINTVELSFDYRPLFDLNTKLNLFAYKAEEIIRFVPDEQGTSTTAQNKGNQEGYGFEVETKWDVSSQFQIQGNYSFQYSIDLETNTNAGLAPKNQIYVLGKWEFAPNWSLNPSVRWIGGRERVVNDPRVGIDDYTIVDLTLRRRNIIDGLSAAVMVRNIFDEKAFEPSPYNSTVPTGALVPGDYPLEGRSIMGEIRYNF